MKESAWEEEKGRKRERDKDRRGDKLICKVDDELPKEKGRSKKKKDGKLEDKKRNNVLVSME